VGNLIVALLSTFNVAFRTICIVNTVRATHAPAATLPFSSFARGRVRSLYA
jgi:hypothetical protein